MSDITKSYIVLIEWDGEKPPRRWYSRMHKLAGRVRGDKGESPLTRRDGGKGIIFQEGCIICPSESLARQMAFQVRDQFGASAVSIGEARMTDKFQMTRADAAVMERVEQSLGKRGRKPPEKDWVITCLEEMKAYHVKIDRPLQCPHCSGLRVHVREGLYGKLEDDGDDVLRLWLRSRFVGPHWEPMGLSTDGSATFYPPSFESVEILNEREADAATKIDASDVLKVAEKLDRNEAIELLDAIFVGRTYVDAEKRTAARVEAVTQYFLMGGQPKGISIAETPTPDLLDTAAMLGPEYAARLMLDYGNGHDEN